MNFEYFFQNIYFKYQHKKLYCKLIWDYYFNTDCNNFLQNICFSVPKLLWFPPKEIIIRSIVTGTGKHFQTQENISPRDGPFRRIFNRARQIGMNKVSSCSEMPNQILWAMTKQGRATFLHPRMLHSSLHTVALGKNRRVCLFPLLLFTSALWTLIFPLGGLLNAKFY